mmetsp:Transcript_148837/g.478103  ORF Transcript_148837/g.478103 Transcript_148837/m.478103 type:complete len:461 (+) Transcript_148837:905-2287(+)
MRVRKLLAQGLLQVCHARRQRAPQEVHNLLAHLHEQQGANTLRHTHEEVAELILVDDPRAVRIHQVDHVFEVVVHKGDAVDLEQVGDLRQQLVELVEALHRHTFPVDVDFVEELAAIGHEHPPLGLALDSLLLHTDVVLLKHALVDDTCQQRDHAKGTEDHESEYEAREHGLLPENACIHVGLQVWVHHEVEQTEHGLVDAPELGHEQRDMVLAPTGVSRTAEAADQYDRANVEHANHQYRHPHDGFGCQQQPVGQHVQWLHEPHDAEEPEDPEQPHDAEDRRDASALLLMLDHAFEQVDQAQGDDGEIKNVPLEIHALDGEEGVATADEEPQRQLKGEDHEERRLDRLPMRPLRHVRLHPDDDGVGRDDEAHERLERPTRDGDFEETRGFRRNVLLAGMASVDTLTRFDDRVLLAAAPCFAHVRGVGHELIARGCGSPARGGLEQLSGRGAGAPRGAAE